MTGPRQESPAELAAAYVLDALSPEEARAFEAFLATSEEARQEVAELQEVAALLALGGEAAGPATDLRERLLGRVAADRTRPPDRSARQPTRRPFAPWLALAASLLIALGLALAVLSLRRQVATRDLALAGRDRALAGRERQLATREATLEALLEPGVRLFQLTASGDPEPLIQVFWDQQRDRAIVHALRLRPVPAGKSYQLWFIQKGKPVPSVTFKVGADGRTLLRQVIVPADGVSAAAVTLEPEGGSAQPTSPILLLGKLTPS